MMGLNSQFIIAPKTCFDHVCVASVHCAMEFWAVYCIVIVRRQFHYFDSTSGKTWNQCVIVKSFWVSLKHNIHYFIQDTPHSHS